MNYAAAQGHAPEAVLAAAKILLADHFDLAAIGWEKGTTVVAVFKWDSTAAVRFTLTADLSDVLTSDYVTRPRKQS